MDLALVVNSIKRNPFYLLLSLFILTRVIFYYTIQLDFIALLSQMQLADIDLLRHDLTQTIWYMHAQPPLFNLYTGLFLKVFKSTTATIYALSIAHKALTFFAAFAIYRTLYIITKRAKLALLVYMVVLLHPTVLLYEHLYSYTQFEFFFIAISLYLFVQFLYSKEERYVVALSYTLALLCMMRSFFHPYLILLIIALIILLMAKKKRVTGVKSMLPVMLIFAWCYKNYILYGVFSLTSFLGLNMVKMYKIESGPLSKISPFSPLDTFQGAVAIKEYPEAFPLLNSKQTSLGAINLNNINYIRISKAYQEEIKKEYLRIDKLPKVFRRIIDATFIYFNPSGNYTFFFENNNKIYNYARIFNVYLYKYDQAFIDSSFPNDKKSFLLIAGITLLLMFCSGYYILYHKNEYIFFFLFTVLLVAYICFIGCTLEYGENNRFRYSTHPVLFVWLGMALDFAYNAYSNQFKKKAG